MASEVKIIMSLVDNVSDKMKGITGSTGGLGSAFKDLTGISLGAAGGIALLGKGLAEGIKFTKDSINETVAYNKTVREMTQVTGLSADSISRIVQVGDDWGVSIDAIRTSLAFMNKSGVTPSIDNIAKLAEEYVNTADKSAFAEKAVKVLGRGYQTLIPLLALGGDGFRDAAAGIDASMIATEDGMAASREYEVVMDDLTDTVTGLKYELGNGLIPALVDLLGAVNDVTSEITSEEAAWKKLKQAHEDGLITQGELTAGYLKLSSGIWDVEDATKYLTTATAELKAKYEMAYPEEQKFTQGMIDLSTATTEATAAFIPMTTSVADNKEAMWDAFNAAQGLTGAQVMLHDTTDSLVNDAINGLNASMVETTAMTWAWQLATNAITQAQYDQNMEMIPQLANLESLGQLLDDGSISFSKYFQTVRDGKVSNEELISNLVSTGMSASAAAAAVAALTANIYGIPDRDIYIRTHMSTIYDENPRQENARGANYIVPPGYNENWNVGTASSGEHVEITPAVNKTNANNTNNFNMTVNTNAQSSTMMRDFNMMKAMAG